MAGDDRVRYCPQCKLSVYNFAAFNQTEINALIAQREGRLCARLYQRPDGTMLTRNCPAVVRTAIKQASRFASATLAAIMSVGPISVAQNNSPQDPSLVQIEQTQGPVLIHVVDVLNSSVAGAPVKLVNEKTGAEFNGKTDAEGQLRMRDLPKGHYQLSVSAPGFMTFTESHVVFPAQTPLQIQLSVGVLVGEVVTIKPSVLHRFVYGVRHLFS